MRTIPDPDNKAGCITVHDLDVETDAAGAPLLLDRTRVYTRTLPNLDRKHADVESAENEYSAEDIACIDLVGLPARAEHSDRIRSVGTIVDQDYAAPHFHLLVDVDDDDSPETRFTQNALANGYYGSSSLAHRYSTVVMRSANSDKLALATKKIAFEVSFVHEPGRANADNVELLPSSKFMRSSNYDCLSRFASVYKHPAPPDPPHVEHTGPLGTSYPALIDYVQQTLEPSVLERAHALFGSRGFVQRSAKCAQEERRARAASRSKISSDGNQIPTQHQQQEERRQPTNTAEHTAHGTPIHRVSISERQTPTMSSSTNQQAGSASAPPPTQENDAAAASSAASTSPSTTQQQPGAAAAASSTSTTSPPQPAASSSAVPAATDMATDGVDANGSLESLTVNEGDPPDVVMAKLIARDKLNSQKLAIFEKKASEERAAAERAAAEARAAQEKHNAEEASRLSTAAASMTSMLTDMLGGSDEEKTSVTGGMKNTIEMMLKSGHSPEEINNTLGSALGSIVAMSRREADQARVNQETRMRALARQAAATFTTDHSDAAKSHGGFVEPPARTQPSTNNAPLGMPVPKKPTVAGKHSGFYAVGDTVSEGTVAASAKTGNAPTGSHSQQSAEEVQADVDTSARGWARKVYESLIRHNPETGEYLLPSYDQVARGGVRREYVVKRNAANQPVKQVVERPMFDTPVHFGPQHLFPDETNAATAHMMTRREDFDQQSVIASAERFAQVFGNEQSRVRSKNPPNFVNSGKAGDTTRYTTSSYWINPALNKWGTAV